MTTDDLCYESTVSLARRIRAGEVSPREAGGRGAHGLQHAGAYEGFDDLGHHAD